MREDLGRGGSLLLGSEAPIKFFRADIRRDRLPFRQVHERNEPTQDAAGGIAELHDFGETVKLVGQCGIDRDLGHGMERPCRERSETTSETNLFYSRIGPRSTALSQVGWVARATTHLRGENAPEGCRGVGLSRRQVLYLVLRRPPFWAVAPPAKPLTPAKPSPRPFREGLCPHIPLRERGPRGGGRARRTGGSYATQYAPVKSFETRPVPRVAEGFFHDSVIMRTSLNFGFRS